MQKNVAHCDGCNRVYSLSSSSSSSEDSFFLAFLAGLAAAFFRFLGAPESVPPLASYSFTALLYSSFILMAFCSHSCEKLRKCPAISNQ